MNLLRVRFRRTSALHTGCVLLVIAAAGCGPQAPPQSSASTSTTAAVQPSATATATLEIDFGNGRKKRFAALPWRSSMTVIDLLTAARDGAGGPQFQQSGSGESALVEAIDGVHNWHYRINGQLGTVSSGVATVQDGDHVLWQHVAAE